MSKLIIAIVSAILFSAAFLIGGGKQRPMMQQAWGKSRGDVNIRILELESANGLIVLEAEIMTVLPRIQVQWKMPTGAVIVEGVDSEVLTPLPGQTLLRHRITIQVGDLPGAPHVVFTAYEEKNGERNGQTRVFNLKPDPDQTARTQKIQQMMIDRAPHAVE